MQLFLAVISVAVVLCGAQVSNPCPGVGSQYIGFSVGGSCPAGSTNVKNFCCTYATTTVGITETTPTPKTATSCPAGSAPIGPCISGLCAPGTTCVGNNVCCATS
uniref:CC domain-containing protein n=1 Tax=Plectus sambesii TaxID=2011161 RepID=A0A914X897_9BILA